MAVWSNKANNAMTGIAQRPEFTNAQLSTFRTDVSNWANANQGVHSQLFDVGNYHLRAYANGNEITNVEIAE